MLKYRDKNESGVTCQKRIPLSRLFIHVVFQENCIGRFERFFSQEHFRFLRSKITFARITSFTSGYEICPGILPAFSARDYVVNSQLSLSATVLTFITIAFKYILPGKINALVRGVNISV
jgi:hypothetical protein